MWEKERAAFRVSSKLDFQRRSTTIFFTKKIKACVIFQLEEARSYLLRVSPILDVRTSYTVDLTVACSNATLLYEVLVRTVVWPWFGCHCGYVRRILWSVEAHWHAAYSYCTPVYATGRCTNNLDSSKKKKHKQDKHTKIKKALLQRTVRHSTLTVVRSSVVQYDVDHTEDYSQ